MKKKLTAKQIYLIAIGVVALAIAVTAICWSVGRKEVTRVPAPAVTSAPVRPEREYVEVEKIVQVEKEFSAEIIQDGLRDMGFLVTEEYYFTEVMTYSSVKKLFNLIELGFTESGYVAGYDGKILAGVNFEGISVIKDEDNHKITISIPAAEIISTDIDPESFVLYSEKEGVGNRVSVVDYNDSLIQLEKNATEKALKRGLLSKAETNAKQVITNFVNSVVDRSVYSVEIEVG